MDKVSKFMKFEKIFFRIELILIGIGLFFYAIFLMFLEGLASLADTWIQIFMLGWLLIIVNFAITIIRVLKYLISVRKLEGPKSIWRSMVVLLLSPIAFILYYILIFVAAISGCSA